MSNYSEEVLHGKLAEATGCSYSMTIDEILSFVENLRDYVEEYAKEDYRGPEPSHIREAKLLISARTRHRERPTYSGKARWQIDCNRPGERIPELLIYWDGERGPWFVVQRRSGRVSLVAALEEKPYSLDAFGVGLELIQGVRIASEVTA